MNTQMHAVLCQCLFSVYSTRGCTVWSEDSELHSSLLNDPLLSTREVSRVTNIKERTLERYRLLGKGPKFVRISGSGTQPRLVRYHLSSIESWIRGERQTQLAA